MALRRSTRATSVRPPPAPPPSRDSSPEREDDTDLPVSLGAESEGEAPRCDSSDDDSGPPENSGDRRPLSFVRLGADPTPSTFLSSRLIIPGPNLISNVTRDLPNENFASSSTHSSHTPSAFNPAATSPSATPAGPPAHVPAPHASSAATYLHAPPLIRVDAPSASSPSTASAITLPVSTANAIASSSRITEFSAADVHEAHSFVRSVINNSASAATAPMPATIIPAALPASTLPLPSITAPAAEASSSSRTSPPKKRARAGKEKAHSPTLHASTVDRVESALRHAVPIHTRDRVSFSSRSNPLSDSSRPHHLTDSSRPHHPLPSRPSASIVAHKPATPSNAHRRPVSQHSYRTARPSASSSRHPPLRNAGITPLASPAVFAPKDPTPRSGGSASFPASFTPRNTIPHSGVRSSSDTPAHPALRSGARNHRSGSMTASNHSRPDRMLAESELKGILYKYGHQLLRETGLVPSAQSHGTGNPNAVRFPTGPPGPSHVPSHSPAYHLGGSPLPRTPVRYLQPRPADRPAPEHYANAPPQRTADRFGDGADRFGDSALPASAGRAYGFSPNAYSDPALHDRHAGPGFPPAFVQPARSFAAPFAAPYNAPANERDTFYGHPHTFPSSRLDYSRDAAYALDPNEIVIPETVISILRNGWWDYIPLDALTNDACHSAAFGSLKQDDTTLGLNDRGHITQRSVMIDSRKEKHLDCTTWKQSSDNLLSALRDHLVIFDAHGRPDRSATGYVIASYDAHFKYLKARGDIETNFPSYILYCIFVRRQWLAHRRTGKRDVPLHVFQIEVFSDIERKRMHRRVDVLAAAAAATSSKPFRGNASESGNSAKSASGDRTASKKGESASGRAKSSQPYSSDRSKSAILCMDQTTSGEILADISTAGVLTVPRAARAATPASTNMGARSAALSSTVLNAALRERFLPVTTPLKHWRWTALLAEAGALEEFAEVPKGLQFGFSLGLESFVLDHTFSPPNHYKSTAHHAFVEEKYAEEIRLGRVSPGYPPHFVSELFGHYRTAPLNVIERTPGKLRITVDHSFPRDNPFTHSVNSCINSKRFQCAWGTFSDCFLLVADAPPGTEACVFDVDAAFRNIPTSPLDRTATALLINGLVHLDGRLNFGLSASPGIFGWVADAIVRIFLHKGIEALLKWVDDFVFFRYPRKVTSGSQAVFSYDESLIWSIADDLGWPWAPEKFVPFSTVFTYIGFEWSLRDKTVRLPDTKRAKYLLKLSSWTLGAHVSLFDTESLIGTLNHITLVVPDGRSHLPALFKFRSGFRDSAPWIKHRVTHTVFSEISCNGISPSDSLPASESLLCAYASSFAGSLAGTTIRNKCSALRKWHIANGLQWHGGTKLSYVIKGAENIRPPSSIMPLRPAVSVEMLRVLSHELDPSDPFDCCALFVATTAFWGQIRLGELLPSKEDDATSNLVPCWSHLGVPNAAGSQILHLPRTKTGGARGESVIITRQSELDPITYLQRHRELNGDSAIMASYRLPSGDMRAMTRRKFITRCNRILAPHGFTAISGHCFRIGGTTHFLLAGVPPDIVKLMGRWSSDSFLRYWRSLEIIAPLYAELLQPLCTNGGC
ncbi:hypothetical protein D9615_009073 [Tricholomella constricta]|uniref:Reverse transcriptase domain-containing protein n=1 Tax=Tricholomella constricta TaxID=117010 RepID=A0A8H5H0L6_9AGAR|nr:hypothetical protein D9615_009073 [Tricholomella constricta]